MRNMNTRAHVFVSGRVQGVFFRVETRCEALKRNVAGWVRNTSDARVEAVFEGKKVDVTQLVDFCGHGPSSARVAKIDVKWEEHMGEFDGFKIRKTVML